jgi:hypothetical protein
MRQRAYQRNGKMKKNFHFGTKGKKAWLLALSLFCWCTTAAMAQTTYNSIASGNWNSTSTWLPAGVPGSVEGDVVVINTGHTVTLNVSPTNTLASVTVNSNGTLRYGSAQSYTLKARDVTVNSGGKIELIVPAFFTQHELRLEPLSTDPANVTTTFQNNGTVDFVNTLTTCVTRFTRSTKGLQWLRGTTGTFDLGPVLFLNSSTVLPPDDFAPLPETDATQIIGEPGGSAITMQNLVIDNAVARVRGTTFTSPTRYREDNPTLVYVQLIITQGIFLERGILILNKNNGSSLTHTVGGNIQIGSDNSIAEVHTDGNGEVGARHNTGIALVSAANATTTLTVTGNVSAPSLIHTDEGVVIALVSPASGNGSNDNSNSGATMTVNGDFDFSGARLGLVGNGTQSFFLAGDIGPGQGGFANGTMQFNFKGDFKLKNGSRYNGRRGGGGSVPGIRFNGTTQTFDAPPNVWYGSETNAITNWEIAANSQVTMTSTSGIAIHGGFGLTVDGTLIAQNGAELISTFTGGGSGKTLLTMGSNGIIRVADPEGLGNGDLVDPSPEPLFIGRQSPSSPPPEGWNLTSINTAGTIDYNGTALQTITARNGSALYARYHRLTISGGDKTLESTNGSVVVNDQLTLQGGIVNRVNASDVVQVLNNATGAVTRTSGHINARLQRAVTGVSQTYLFPIGDNTTYRQISLTLTSLLGTSLRAELIEDNANDLAGVNSPLQKASDLRYYSFLNTGPNNVSISQVNNMAINADDAVNQASSNNTLKIATRVGGNWQSQGPAAVNTSSLPTTFSSNTFSESVVANNTFFVSLGTTNPTDDPLPVELIGFKGEATVLGVVLQWQTASERDNAGFMLVRNGEVIADYREHAALRGAGTSAVGRRYQFVDERVREGERYVYALRSMDFDGTVHDYAVRVEVEGKRVSRDYELMQNYPNPFNPVTTIRYVLPEESEVRVRVYDMLGRMVKEVVGGVRQGAGVYEVRFEGSDLGSGVYVYRLEAVGSRGRYVASKKMVLMK